MNIILVGAKGKMATVVKEIAKEFDTKICYEIDKNFTKPKNNQSKYFSEIPLEIIKQTDLVLDFSTPHVLKDELDFCVKAQLPLVICSTGHTKLDEDEITNASTATSADNGTNVSDIKEFSIAKCAICGKELDYGEEGICDECLEEKYDERIREIMGVTGEQDKEVKNETN